MSTAKSPEIGLGKRLWWQVERQTIAREARRIRTLREALGVPGLVPRVQEEVIRCRGNAPDLPAPPRGGVVAVSIATPSHLPRLEVMAASFRTFHPDIDLYVLVLCDPGTELPASQFYLPVRVDDIGLLARPYLALKFDTMELSCAAKPLLVRFAMERLGAERVLYLDSDLCFYAPADELLEATSQADVVVTPHLFRPYPMPERHWEAPRLSQVMSSGLLNAGLFSMRCTPGALSFLRTWEELCTGYGACNPTDSCTQEQHAFNWVLSFCESVHLLRAREYNVAYWNLHERSLTGGIGQFRIDGKPLVVFHFSGYEPEHPTQLSRHDRRHRAFHHGPLAALVDDYARRIDRHRNLGSGEPSQPPFSRFPSGVPIDQRIRAIFKRWELELEKPPALDPFSVSGEAVYCRALLGPVAGTGSLCPVLVDNIIAERHDLQCLFPERHLRPDAALRWFSAHGVSEYGYNQLFDQHRPTVVRADRLDEIFVNLTAARSAGWTHPLGVDRSSAIDRLERSGNAGRQWATRLRQLDDELYCGTSIGALRRLVQARDDIVSAYPDLLFEGAKAFSAWIGAYGEPLEGLPSGTCATFQRASNGRALARIAAWIHRTPGLSHHFPLGLVGVGKDAFLSGLLTALGTAPFDAEDIEMCAWVLETEPWRGLPLVLDTGRLALGVLDPPCRATEDHVLAPVLGDPRFRHALEQYRVTRSWRYRDRLPSTRPLQPLLADPRSARVPSTTVRGLHCFGFTGSSSGLGTMSRGLVAALRAERFRVLENVLGDIVLRPDLELDDVTLHFDPEVPLNLWVSFPHRETRLFDLLPRFVSSSRRNVVYLAWEQASAPDHWADVFSEFDDVWALSHFAASSLTRALGRTVAAVPCVLDEKFLPQVVDRRLTPLPPERFVATTVFDANSSIERKNPEAVVEAFARAFRRDDPVTLYLRVTNANNGCNRGRVRRLVDRATATGLDIHIDVGPRNHNEILHLLGASDAYLSLHRAEGFGYTCAEAMALAVPTIATGYSGNLEFMTKDNSLLVDARPCEVEVADGPFVRGSVWAEPDVEQAGEFLRGLFEQPERGRLLGEVARRDVRRMLSPAAVGARCASLLGYAAWDAGEPQADHPRS